MNYNTQTSAGAVYSIDFVTLEKNIKLQSKKLKRQSKKLKKEKKQLFYIKLIYILFYKLLNMKP